MKHAEQHNSIGHWFLTPNYIGPKRHVYVVGYEFVEKMGMHRFTLIEFFSEHDITFGTNSVGPDKHWTSYSPTESDMRMAIKVTCGDRP
jgi:hypothetical protein